MQAPGDRSAFGCVDVWMCGCVDASQLHGKQFCLVNFFFFLIFHCFHVKIQFSLHYVISSNFFLQTYKKCFYLFLAHKEIKKTVLIKHFEISFACTFISLFFWSATGDNHKIFTSRRTETLWFCSDPLPLPFLQDSRPC